MLKPWLGKPLMELIGTVARALPKIHRLIHGVEALDGFLVRDTSGDKVGLAHSLL